MEEEILQLLSQSPGQPFSVKQISKCVDRSQYRENPDWARPFVQSLLRKQRVEKNLDGRYFVPVEARS